MQFDLLAMTDALAAYLQTSGVGVLQKTLFRNQLPGSPLAAIAVVCTGGSERSGDPLRRPSVQILVRDTADRLRPTLALAHRIHQLFDQKVVQLVGLTARCVPDHVPGPWYRDVNQNVVATLNFGLVVQPTS